MNSVSPRMYCSGSRAALPGKQSASNAAPLRLPASSRCPFDPHGPAYPLFQHARPADKAGVHIGVGHARLLQAAPSASTQGFADRHAEAPSFFSSFFSSSFSTSFSSSFSSFRASSGAFSFACPSPAGSGLFFPLRAVDVYVRVKVLAVVRRTRLRGLHRRYGDSRAWRDPVRSGWSGTGASCPASGGCARSALSPACASPLSTSYETPVTIGSVSRLRRIRPRNVSFSMPNSAKST